MFYYLITSFKTYFVDEKCILEQSSNDAQCNYTHFYIQIKTLNFIILANNDWFLWVLNVCIVKDVCHDYANLVEIVKSVKNFGCNYL